MTLISCYFFIELRRVYPCIERTKHPENIYYNDEQAVVMRIMLGNEAGLASRIREHFGETIASK